MNSYALIKSFIGKELSAEGIQQFTGKEYISNGQIR